MVREYGKWPETKWLSTSVDWKTADCVCAGVDIGTTSTQAAILADGALFGYASIRTGADWKNVAGIALQQAMGASGMTQKDVQRIAATGFGKQNVSFAEKKIDEIQCHGIGARYLFGPSVMTVVDLGAQTVKAILMYKWDRVRDFKISDKCATGFGRSIETMANLLHVPITEMGEKSLDVERDPEPVSTTCGNFACPEAINLFRQGYKEEKYDGNKVLAAYLFAVSWRALSTIGKLSTLDIGEIRAEEKVAFTGGLAKNKGITTRLERELGIVTLQSNHNPQIAGAVGAALLAGRN